MKTSHKFSLSKSLLYLQNLAYPFYTIKIEIIPSLPLKIELRFYAITVTFHPQTYITPLKLVCHP